MVSITLAYGARTPDLLIYRDVVERCARRAPSLSVMYFAEDARDAPGCLPGRVSVDAVWPDRPAPPLGMVSRRKRRYRGEEAQEKIARVRAALQSGDGLLAIDDHPIASDGTVELEGERVDMPEVVERKFRGDVVKLDIWRDKKPLTVRIELGTSCAISSPGRRHRCRATGPPLGGSQPSSQRGAAEP